MKGQYTRPGSYMPMAVAIKGLKGMINVLKYQFQILSMTKGLLSRNQLGEFVFCALLSTCLT